MIRIVLVGTTHPGNIGAVARVMKNMCLHELILVQPKCDHLSSEAIARASGAQGVLQNARIAPDLSAATADCHIVVGTSARQRSYLWPELEPASCAELMLDQEVVGPVSLVFGRESAGLNNQELNYCTHLVYIPANPAYSSLNIAMAVQVITYEIYKQSCQVVPAKRNAELPANMQQMEHFFAHLEQVLYQVDFLQAGREKKILQRLRRMFHRAKPTEWEINLFRGVLSAVQKRY